MASAAREFLFAARKIQLRGEVDGTSHVAAATRGDGACGLHSVFGAPQHHSNPQLFLKGARQVVAERLPPDILAHCEPRSHEALRDLWSQVMSTVWVDLALPAARIEVGLQPADQLTSEMRCIWEETPYQLRDDLHRFARSQAFERKNCALKTKELLESTRTIFVSPHTQGIGSPASVM